MYLMLLKFAICGSAAGTGATEDRGGAGEHPRICEDEEQPAQDQAGDRRRGTNHLKTSKVSGSGWLCVWLWAPRHLACLCERARELVCGGDLTVVQDELSGFSTLSCSFLQWGERLYVLKTAPLPACLPGTASTHLFSSQPFSSTQHPLQEGLDTVVLCCFSVSFQWALMEKIHMQEFSSPLFSLMPPQQALVFFHPFQCCYCRLCCSYLYNQISKSGHWIDSWSCVM